MGSGIRDKEGLWDLYWITWSDDRQRGDVRSGTSHGLGLTSLPVALRVKLKWSVSHLGDWCEVCSSWGEAWALALPSRTLHLMLQTSPTTLLVLMSLCQQWAILVCPLASFCPEAMWFYWWRTSCSTGSLALPFIDSMTLGKFLASLNFGFHIGFLSENQFKWLY